MPNKEEKKEEKPVSKGFEVVDKNGKVFKFSKKEGAEEHARAIGGKVVK